MWRWLCCCAALWPALAGGQSIWAEDFEQAGDRLPDGLAAVAPATATVVDGGPAGSRRCLLVTNAQPGKYASVNLGRPFTLVRNLVLSFDVRAEADGPTNYVGINAYDAARNQFFGSVPFQAEWQHAEVAIASLHPTTGGSFSLGQAFATLNLYGRARDDAGTTMRVWFDNLRLQPQAATGRVSDRTRTSNANPPFFVWPRSDRPTRLQWSREPGFPAAGTTTVEVAGNWHLPAQAFEPGTWYWRADRSSELFEGWTDAERVIVPELAHRFQAGRIDFARLTARPHPRLLDAPAERAARTPEQLAALVQEAATMARDGIADDCPIWVEGDPRWPTWIDWYGKAHGGLTSRAGSRLQRLGWITAVTGDATVREQCLAMALKAAKWDPQGGSEVSRGDIGAHHFLRGLNWAYDALAGQVPATRLEPVRQALEVRALQFWDRHNPFRANEYNNHSWLNVMGLAESGLVLAGELPAATDWAQYSLDLFVGRFLCALGYQGDNNEGISYWGYGLLFVIAYAEMMKEVCGIDLFQHPWLYQTARFPMYCAPPGGYAVSFADTGQPNHGYRGPSQKRQVLDLARQTGDPYALWYGGATAPVNGVAPKPPADLPQSIWYRFIGWTLFNTDLVDGRRNVAVAMRSGPFYAGHQHEDLNGFVIHAYGEKLAIDGGHYDWFGSPQFKNWSVLTRAHNSLLLDGRDQNSRRDGADGRISAYFDAPDCGYTVGEVDSPLVYDGRLKHWTRRLLFLKPGLVVVHDQLAANGEPARYDWLLQSVGEVKVTAGQPAFSLTSGTASLGGRFLAPADVDLAVTSGFPANAQPVDRYSTRPSPPEVTPLEYHLTATPRARRTTEEIVTALTIAPGATAPVVEPVAVAGGYGLQVATGKLRTTVIGRLGDAAATVTGGGLRTDARVAWLTHGDRARHATGGLVEGTFVRLAAEGGDEEVVSSTRPVSLSLTQSPAGLTVHVAAAEACRLRLQGVRGERVSLDNQQVAGQDDERGGRLVDLPAGEHVVLVGPDADALQPAREARAQVSVGGVAQPLAAVVRRTFAGDSWTRWGSIEVARADRYELRAAPAGDLGVAVDGTAWPAAQARWLAAGPHLLTVSGGDATLRLELVATGSQAVSAVMLPTNWRLPVAAPRVEAEQPVAEGDVKGKVNEKIGASGGVAHCVWDTDGQWAEWVLEVPQAGRWELLIRAAGDDGEVLRSLLVDGQPLAGAAVVRLGPTGGWCRTADDWRWCRVPVAADLAAGRHVVRLERVGGSLNLDQLAWLPVSGR